MFYVFLIDFNKIKNIDLVSVSYFCFGEIEGLFFFWYG